MGSLKALLLPLLILADPGRDQQGVPDDLTEVGYHTGHHGQTYA